MARIRTIKPEFFRHELLYDAERETGLPLRLAFIALWTVADREGRFKWRPRSLKPECLPHDDVDFAAVLEALRGRGFIVRYEVNGAPYGLIPSFLTHQIINNRESPSTIPAPISDWESVDWETGEVRVESASPRDGDASSTRQARDGHAPCGEGKGKEGKGKEGNGYASRGLCNAFTGEGGQ